MSIVIVREDMKERTVKIVDTKDGASGKFIHEFILNEDDYRNKLGDELAQINRKLSSLQESKIKIEGAMRDVGVLINQ